MIQSDNADVGVIWGGHCWQHGIPTKQKRKNQRGSAQVVSPLEKKGGFGEGKGSHEKGGQLKKEIKKKDHKKLGGGKGKEKGKSSSSIKGNGKSGQTKSKGREFL